MPTETPQPLPAITAHDFSLFCGPKGVLRQISLQVRPQAILGIIGPAGSGKTSFLRALNRLNDLEPGWRTEGLLRVGADEIYAPGYDAVALRRRVGMVFALPVSLPMSIYENVVYGPRLAGMRNRSDLDSLVESSLQAVVLWDEVKDRLQMNALRLSGGQQQRLCLARVLAMKPEIILLDEPCSGLDPVSTAKIEESLTTLKARHTIILVTNNTKQAARVADHTAFLLMGELVEYGATSEIFTLPRDPRTSDYVTGRFG